MRERIAWIDRMRGIAIMSVVVQHLIGWLNNEFVYHELIGLLSTSLFAIIISYICCNIYDYISRIPIHNFIFFGQRK